MPLMDLPNILIVKCDVFGILDALTCVLLVPSNCVKTVKCFDFCVCFYPEVVCMCCFIEKSHVSIERYFLLNLTCYILNYLMKWRGVFCAFCIISLWYSNIVVRWNPWTGIWLTYIGLRLTFWCWKCVWTKNGLLCFELLYKILIVRIYMGLRLTFSCRKCVGTKSQ